MILPRIYRNKCLIKYFEYNYRIRRGAYSVSRCFKHTRFSSEMRSQELSAQNNRYWCRFIKKKFSI